MSATIVPPATPGGSRVQRSKWANASWHEKQAALEAAFRKLDIKTGHSVLEGRAIPYAVCIPLIARQILLLATSPKPRHPTVSGNKARKELKKLAMVTRRCVAVLDGISQTALDALPTRLEFFNLPDMTKKLRMLSASANAAEPPPVQAQRKKDLPAIIAQEVALHYCRLTGEKPTRRTDWDTKKAYGPFLNLLDNVYEILNVKAKADSVVKAGALAHMEFS